MAEIIRGTLRAADIKLSDSELSARVGRPVSAREADVARALEALCKVANVCYVATRVKILTIAEDVVQLDGIRVTSSALARYFSGCSETYIFLATLGAEVDRLIMKKKALSLSEGFTLDCVASALIETACDEIETRLCSAEETKNRFSPGYSDCPLTVQRDIFSVLSANKYIGVKLLDSLLMTPMKSVSAFVAVLEK